MSLFKMQQNYNIKRWQVISLALAGFIFNTSEFIPVALLSDIAQSFSLPVEEVGLMITLYAWIVATLSLPAVLITAKIERKKLLLGIFILFIVSHIISAIANSFLILLISRTGVALAQAVFWSITSSLVVRLAPEGKQTQSLGLLSIGSALAVVLGLPLGRIVGQYLGWRTTFGGIGLLAFVIMGLVAWLLPTLPSKNSGSLSSLNELRKNNALITVYILVAFVVTAHFTAYSYIEPFTKQVNQLSDGYTTIILLVFGVAGMLASMLIGRFYEKYPKSFLFFPILLELVSLLSMASMTSFTSWIILAVVWGMAMMAMGLVLQLLVIRLAPNNTDIAMSIFSGIYNVGIGGGALLGNLIIIHYGLKSTGYTGAIVAFLAALVVIVSYIMKKNKIIFN